MRKIMHPAISLIGLLFGIVALLYLKEVHGGIVKHTPPCAPITGSTVFMVFAFTSTGAALGILGLLVARRRLLWLPVVLLTLLLNLSALAIWGHWIGSKTLLPYGAWCEKMSMG